MKWQISSFFNGRSEVKIVATLPSVKKNSITLIDETSLQIVFNILKHVLISKKTVWFNTFFHPKVTFLHLESKQILSYGIKFLVLLKIKNHTPRKNEWNELIKIDQILSRSWPDIQFYTSWSKLIKFDEKSSNVMKNHVKLYLVILLIEFHKILLDSMNSDQIW